MANDLGAFITAEVARAEADFQAGRARALSVVGFTTGIVGLVSGLLAIAAGSQKDILPKQGFLVLVLALLAFVGAAGFALSTNFTASVSAADLDSMKGFVASNWSDEGWDQQVADLYVDYAKSLRAANKRTSNLVNTAIVFEIAGIVLLSLMTVIIVWHLY